MEDPFEASTITKWLKVTDSEYEALYSISRRTGKCVRPDCTNFRKSIEDMLCPIHRKEYNKWSEQFFSSVHKENIKEVKE